MRGVEVETIAWSRRLRWMALAAIPSSLMLGVTSYISSEVAPVPLIWILPLALYLATLVIAFAATEALSRMIRVVFAGVISPRTLRGAGIGLVATVRRGFMALHEARRATGRRDRPSRAVYARGTGLSCAPGRGSSVTRAPHRLLPLARDRRRHRWLVQHAGGADGVHVGARVSAGAGRRHHGAPVAHGRAHHPRRHISGRSRSASPRRRFR